MQRHDTTATAAGNPNEQGEPAVAARTSDTKKTRFDEWNEQRLKGDDSQTELGPPGFGAHIYDNPRRPQDAAYLIRIDQKRREDRAAAWADLREQAAKDPSNTETASTTPLSDIPPPHLTRQSAAAWHFTRLTGNQVRFDHQRNRWLIWSKHYWKPDENGKVKRLWLETLNRRHMDALKEANEHERITLIKEVGTAGATDSAIRAGLDIASNMDPIATQADAWDQNPYLLACANGVIDLHTGDLQPGDPNDMISRCTHVAYDPNATAPRWEHFVNEVFAPNPDIPEWYQRLVGSSLIGDSREILAIHHGTGNNGKSIATKTLTRAFGDYGTIIPIETLVNAKRQAGEATPDLMRLRGARIAFTSEPDQTAKLRGGTLKRLTSVDTMTGRSLYGITQSWEPTHTPHLATNHLPSVDDATNGFWRRIALIPWHVHFREPGEPGTGPTADPDLARTLLTELPGILLWAIKGAIATASSRSLKPFPASVAAETAQYKSAENQLTGFIDSRLIYVPTGELMNSLLHTTYLDWCVTENIPTGERLGRNTFYRQFLETTTGTAQIRNASNVLLITGISLRPGVFR